MEQSTSTVHTGKLIEVIGPVIVVQFESGHLPAIYNAVRVSSEGFDVPEPISVIAEVEQHLGEGRVKCVAMERTDGMVRGMSAVDLGEPITVPVGKEVLGRVLNVIGEPVDNLGPVNTKQRLPIHRQAPELDEQNTNLEAFETGIKVVDLIEPYLKGGKTGPLRRRRCRQDRDHPGAHQQRRHEAWRRLGVLRSG